MLVIIVIVIIVILFLYLNNCKEDYTILRDSKIAVVSLSCGNRPFTKYPQKRLKEYCRKNNYDLYYYKSNLITEKKLPLVWNKIPAL